MFGNNSNIGIGTKSSLSRLSIQNNDTFKGYQTGLTLFTSYTGSSTGDSMIHHQRRTKRFVLGIDGSDGSGFKIARGSDLSKFGMIGLSPNTRTLQLVKPVLTSATGGFAVRALSWSPELQKAVAVSWTGSNRMLYSTDLINWTPSSTGYTEGSWTSVCWSPKIRKFVAGSTGPNSAAQFATSADGEAWSLIFSYTGADIRDICWVDELSRFVAAASGSFLNSTDGTTWSSSAFTNDWTAICFSPELRKFVAVGGGIGTANRVATSENGSDWTSQTAAEDNRWTDVCWAPPPISKFVRVSSTGTTARISYSETGAEWISVTNTGATGTFQSVKWVSEIKSFVALSSNQGSYYSPNGINWTNSGDIGSYAEYSSELGRFITASDVSVENINVNRFSGYQNTGTITMTGTVSMLTGTTQIGEINSHVSFGSIPSFRSFTIATGSVSIFSTGSYSKCNVFFDKHTGASQLGIVQQGSSGNTNLHFAAASGKRFVLGIDSQDAYKIKLSRGSMVRDNTILTINPSYGTFTGTIGFWTTGSTGSLPNQSQWSSITYSPELNLFVAGSRSSTGTNIMYSRDGETWTGSSLPGVIAVPDIKWSSVHGLFIVANGSATGTNFSFYTSPDAITWTQRTVFPSSVTGTNSIVSVLPELSSIHVSSSTGFANTMYTSPNTVSWINNEIQGEDFPLVGTRNCAYSPERDEALVICNSGANTLVSRDGVKWSSRIIDRDFTGTNGSIAWSSPLKMYNICGNDAMWFTQNGLTSLRTDSGLQASGATQVYWHDEHRNFISLTSGSLFTSADGLVWNRINNLGISQTAYSPELNRFVGVRSGNPTPIVYTQQNLTYFTGTTTFTMSGTVSIPGSINITSTGGNVTASTYTPTVTSKSLCNVSPYKHYYRRIGNEVFVQGGGIITFTGSTGTYSFRIDMPVVPTSNFSSSDALTGYGVGYNAATGSDAASIYLTAVSSTKTAILTAKYISNRTASSTGDAYYDFAYTTN
jgi:hypothetical protein